MSDAARGKRATVPCAGCGKLNRVDLARIKDGPRCAACRSRLSLDHPVAVTDQTMERVLDDSEVPVVVDFYADWCGPCKIMAPMLDAVARERAGAVLIAKLDTDRNPAMSARYGVRGIPMLVAFRDGHEVAREVGAIPRPRLDALVDTAARR